VRVAERGADVLHLIPGQGRTVEADCHGQLLISRVI
jgi:hypothetical protein